MSDDLKPLPCPFCGEQEGVYSEAGTEATGPHAAIVRCSGCNAVHCHNTEAEAIAAWNRRASDTEIERLRAALVEARDDVGRYASPYFQEKWDLEGNIARIDAALSPLPAPSIYDGLVDPKRTRRVT